MGTVGRAWWCEVGMYITHTTARSYRPGDETSSQHRVLIGYTLEHNEAVFGILRLQRSRTTGKVARVLKDPSMLCTIRVFLPTALPTNLLLLDSWRRSAIEMPRSYVNGNQF